MTDPFPQWPPDWVEDHELAAEQVVAATDDVSLTSALRTDDRLLLSVSWPGGRRWMLVDPVGNHAPEALRIGERAEDGEVARLVEGLWSQALTLAKRLMDGDLTAEALAAAAAAAGEEELPKKKRRWGRG
ncbi:MAG TPA: hypothetical protein VFZ89_17380 [Solirubrobacteraceae bacterium]